MHIIYSSRKLPAFSNASCRLAKVTNLLYVNTGLVTFVSFLYFLIWNFYYIGLRFSFQIYRSISYPGHIWRHSFSFDYCKTLQSHILRRFNICLCRWRRQKSVRHLLFTCWSCTLNGFKLRLLMQITHVHFLIKLLRSLSRAAWHFVWKFGGGGEHSATPGTFWVSESSDKKWRHIR